MDAEGKRAAIFAALATVLGAGAFSYTVATAGATPAKPASDGGEDSTGKPSVESCEIGTKSAKGAEASCGAGACGEQP